MEELFFDKIKIGDILSTENDFPSFNGKLKLTIKPTDNSALELIQLIEHSKRYERFIASESGISDYEPEIDKEKNLIKEASLFLHLIEADSWRIVNDNGKQFKILCPIFGFGDTLVYRLNE